MNKDILAIFDSEERYARGLMEYITQKEKIPFRIHVFTDEDRFYSYQDFESIECLLVSESVYDKKLEELNIPHIIILSESGKVVNSTLHHINKYQSSEIIFNKILLYYSSESDKHITFVRDNQRKLKIIGIYTPIGRCLQTTFAMTLGQLLSKKFKTLYLNFEQYSGLSQLLKREFEADITDLLYYFECAKEKLSVRIDTMVEQVNGLDFIPPVSIYQNLKGIKGEQWIELFAEMEKCTEYEYLILDLTDGMIDLWDVLRSCDIIYTITRQDTIAMAKICQYERALESAEYNDVINKTKRCNLPIFKNLNHRFDELTLSDMASYIKNYVFPEMLDV